MNNFEEIIREIFGDKSDLILADELEVKELKRMDIKTQKIIAKLTDRFQKNNEGTDNWGEFYSKICFTINYHNSAVKTLLDSISDINELSDKRLDTLINVFLIENELGIQSLEEIDTYDEIRDKRCDERFNSTSIFSEKLKCVLLSKFGITMKQAEILVNKYATDIDSIDNEDLKGFINCLEYMLKMHAEEEEKLNLIMNEVEPVMVSEKFNLISLTTSLKKAFMELYISSGLFSIEEAKRYSGSLESFEVFCRDEWEWIEDSSEVDSFESEGIENIIKLDPSEDDPEIWIEDGSVLEDKKDTSSNIYELPTNQGAIAKFGIFIKGILRNNNYYENWNNNFQYNHISTSFVRRDMIGVFCMRSDVFFGFNRLKPDDLVLAGPCDLSSDCDAFYSYADSNKDHYYGPDLMIKKTTQKWLQSHRAPYNEIALRRNRNEGNEQIQPDYIIVFKIDGKLRNMYEARQASLDFEKNGHSLPIIIVDINKCLDAEIQEIAEMKLQLRDMKLEFEVSRVENLERKINELEERIEDKVLSNKATVECMQHLKKDELPKDLNFEIEIDKKMEEIQSKRKKEKEIEDIRHRLYDGYGRENEHDNSKQKSPIQSRLKTIKDIFDREE